MNKCSYIHANNIPDGEQLATVAELFKCMGDPCRLAMLSLLHAHELPVGEIAQRLQHTPSAVSHQLRLLRSLRLVRTRRDGRRILYALDDQHVAELLEVAFVHSRHPHVDDRDNEK
ncbi:MAG TPA: metalloregulator ArsR/SmtB family transcription factor [Candidatus Ozemobacteraceae bacterium]|nr:metalloregulator ArsR/SmtB family transcription factor [Candidatus Ozemobacteraceae bacterium]